MCEVWKFSHSRLRLLFSKEIHFFNAIRMIRSANATIKVWHIFHQRFERKNWLTWSHLYTFIHWKNKRGRDEGEGREIERCTVSVLHVCNEGATRTQSLVQPLRNGSIITAATANSNNCMTDVTWYYHTKFYFMSDNLYFRLISNQFFDNIFLFFLVILSPIPFRLRRNHRITI